MTTSNYVCGTGSWSGPKPGDPDNNLVLSATPIFGGIAVSWSYPAINPYAVAHTILYRSLTNNFAGAVQQAIVSGNQYYDMSAGDVPVEMFYWIQVVSVNGTYGELIGPASATARPTIEETLRQLTGRIDQEVLAQSLRSEIERITDVDASLGKEILDRINANEALASVLEAVQTEVGEAVTLLDSEIIERKGADAALLSSVNTLATGLNGNSAAIVEEQLARTTAIEALAAEIVTLFSKYDENTAAISAESVARADQFTALTTTVNTMVAAVEGKSDAAIQLEQQARVSGDNALTQSISTMQATLTNSFSSAVQTETNARVAADNALASKITTAETTLKGNIASVQTTLQTNINAVGDTVTDIGALYTAKVNVNGLVGGFGVYNDGTTVEAGFDVDRFWVGRTGTDKTKPFIIENDEVFIDKAVIQTLTADMIDTRGLSIKDANGNIILSAGTSLDFDRIGGANKPANGATVGAPSGTYVGGTLAETVASYAANGNSAYNSLESKLDKASSAILNINTTSATRMAGVRMGDIAWDSSGNRTSGKGIAMTPSGLVGHNGTQTTVTVNATTGDAKFYGHVEASSGAISGNFSVGGKFAAGLVKHLYGRAWVGTAHHGSYSYTTVSPTTWRTEAYSAELDQGGLYVVTEFVPYIIGHSFRCYPASGFSYVVCAFEANTINGWQTIAVWAHDRVTVPGNSNVAKVISPKYVSVRRGSTGLNSPIQMSTGDARTRVVTWMSNSLPAPLSTEWNEFLVQPTSTFTLPPDYLNSTVTTYPLSGATADWNNVWRLGAAVHVSMMRVTSTPTTSNGWNWGEVGFGE